AALAQELERAGANLTLRVDGQEPLSIGEVPGRAIVRASSRRALDPLVRRDHLRLAEAYLTGSIEVDGDFLEAIKVTEIVRPDPGWIERILFWLRRLATRGAVFRRTSIAFHYDRPVEFFL